MKETVEEWSLQEKGENWEYLKEGEEKDMGGRREDGS